MTLRARISSWLLGWPLSSTSCLQQSISQTSTRRLQGSKEVRRRFSSRYSSQRAFTWDCAEIWSRVICVTAIASCRHAAREHPLVNLPHSAEFDVTFCAAPIAGRGPSDRSARRRSEDETPRRALHRQSRTPPTIRRRERRNGHVDRARGRGRTHAPFGTASRDNRPRVARPGRANRGRSRCRSTLPSGATWPHQIILSISR